MKNKYENIDELIARVLAGDASESEQKLVEEWASLSEDNRKTLALSGKVFEKSAAARELFTVDTDKAWLKVKSRMNAGTGTGRIIPFSGAGNLKYVWRIAAMLAVAAGLGTAAYFLLTPMHTANDVFIVSTDSVRSELLPDGSSITLNKNSTVAYAAAGYGKKRILELHGEAFFEVKHDEAHAFIVKAGNLSIEDVGTSFNVKSSPDSKIIIVTVATGEVKLYAPDSGGQLVKAGETATYDAGTNSFSKSVNEDKNIAAYRDKIFVFENTELQVIVKLLSDVYGKTIVISNESIKKCRLTASFNNESLDSILSVIAETLQIELIKTESEFQLTGNACR